MSERVKPAQARGEKHHDVARKQRRRKLSDGVFAHDQTILQRIEPQALRLRYGTRERNTQIRACPATPAEKISQNDQAHDISTNLNQAGGTFATALRRFGAKKTPRRRPARGESE